MGAFQPTQRWVTQQEGRGPLLQQGFNPHPVQHWVKQEAKTRIKNVSTQPTIDWYSEPHGRFNPCPLWDDSQNKAARDAAFQPTPQLRGVKTWS
jgi:hypothetical protein